MITFPIAIPGRDGRKVMSLPAGKGEHTKLHPTQALRKTCRLLLNAIPAASTLDR
jgi:hypothetical protein